MAVQKGELIVYQDLIDFVLTNIKSHCSNIDTFASNVPVSLRNGSSYVLASTLVVMELLQPQVQLMMVY